jgi:hypothetical protein
MSETSDKEIIRQAMSLLGSKTSAAKKLASQQNGKKGGRPVKEKSAEIVKPA